MPIKSITYLPVDQLREYQNHSRKHTKSKIQKLANLIREYGFVIPILINGKSEIVAGHARVLAAKEAELAEVPVISIDHLSDNQIRAFRIADNKICEGSEWDYETLKIEFCELIDLNFDLELTAFEIPEIDMVVLGENPSDSTDPNDDLPPLPEHPIVRPGDIFNLGQHRIACIDCRNIDQLTTLMSSNTASMVITDPPYNLQINGVALKRKDIHSEFVMASGEMSSNEYTQFLVDTFTAFRQFSSENSLHYHFIDHKHLYEMLDAGNQVYDKQINICVWVKSNAGMGAFYRSQHEFCCIFQSGRDTHQNNVQLGRFRRNRSNVWHYPGLNSFSEDRSGLLASHPTVKNAQMIAGAILDASKPNDVILDGFLGSGTTVLAADKTGRICYGCEIEPKYIEVCIERFRSVSDAPIIHVETGQTFDELKQSRLQQAHSEFDHGG